MPVLGAGFNMGSSGDDPSSMDMSLDSIIANRSKETRRTSSRNQTAANDPNKVSNVDRSIATSRAKREAALRARRGLSGSKKASAMDIEKEVQKQGKKTLLEKAKKAQQKKGSTAPVKAERRRLARAAAKAKKEELAQKQQQQQSAKGKGSSKVAMTAPLGRPPSKKAVNAAVSAMEDKGFTVPEGYQMVISFAPTDSSQKASAKKNPPNNNNNNRGRGRGGGHK